MTALLQQNVRSTLFYAFICTSIFFNTTYTFRSASELEFDDIQTTTAIHKKPKTQWTFIVYMAADNDLRGFAARNIKQMTAVGSNQEINIVVELHIKLTQNKKITRRYFIEQGKIVHINADDPTTQKMDSGDQQTLISCCAWAMTNYPADQYALILWDHGTGCLDPKQGKIIHATELFSFNPISNKLELDRSIGFLDFISQYNQNQRGICWDDTTGNYLTNQKLAQALEYTCNTYNNGKKFAIIGFDACLMAMVEVADLIKQYADYMIASQEVVLGTGLNYQLVLAPFQQASPTPASLAQHIVSTYDKTYNKITADYTFSAVNLSKIELLDANVNAVANCLLSSLQAQQEERLDIINSVKRSRDKHTCTHFDEPSYIDLHHFYANLKNNLESLQSARGHTYNGRIPTLIQLLDEGKHLIEDIVIANVAGKNLEKARGLSIYFPERKLHFSYEKTPFATHNSWLEFLMNYIHA